MARAYVVKPGAGTVKHIAANSVGDTLCGIDGSGTMKAAGPATLRSLCTACQTAASKSRKAGGQGGPRPRTGRS